MADSAGLRAFAPSGQLAGWWGPAQLALDGTPMVPTPALVPDGAPADSTDGRGIGAPSSASADQLPLELPPAGAQGELPHTRRRQTSYRRRASLRWHQPIQRVARCGLDRIAPSVQLLREPTGRAFLTGVLTCGNVWCCPICSPKVGRERADQITALVQAHEQAGGTVYLLSLTPKHGAGDDLKKVRRGVSDAFRLMTKSKQWKKWGRRVELAGDVRALETTHGERNGWHPHLHVLLFTRPLSPSEEADWDDWIAERWQSAVVRALGPEHKPSLARGTVLSLARDSKYLVKLGLELAGDDGRKEAAHGNRTMWQIADDLMAHGRDRDRELWNAYALGMSGAKQLTWSRKLRDKAAALDLEVDTADEQLAEERGAGELVYVIDRPTWDAVRRSLCPDDVVLRLLEIAERAGTAGVHGELRLVRSRAPS